MDIKDWILVGGGLLLIAVIGHGFWLAWRGRRDTLKIDIEPNIPRGDYDDLDLLRAELPNGGARVRMSEPIEQTDLALEPVVSAAFDKPAHREPFVAQRKTQPVREPVVKHKEGQKESKARPIVPERPRERGRETARAVSQPFQTRPAEKHEKYEDHEEAIEPVAARSVPPEVIVINVLARNGAKFGGTDLMEAFLRNGLKFGDMNIFHRVQPASKEVQFSVASAVEPGTFDLSAMEVFRTPGVSFFMRMPGPGEPLEVFEDMLAVTRDVAASLGADLKDEQLSVMTSQTIQHCRARIEDFSRKRMSQRA
jgi:cell division protein ZipA